MVRCYVKKKTHSCEEKKEKRKRGESSTGIDGLSLHAPKRRRGEGQRVETHIPGSPFFYLLFKFICIELNR
jgi:hypothetical protein